MQQNKLAYYTLNPKQPSNRSGLVFTLPQQIIRHKNSSQSQQHKNLSHYNLVYQSKGSHINSQPISKKLKKIREKSKSMLEISQKNFTGEQFQKQKFMFKETLYKKWMQRTKKAQQSPESQTQKKQKNFNVHLRKLNLIVLSKRQQLKKNIKNQQKQNQKQNQHIAAPASIYTQRSGFSLPNFGRAKSTFSKPSSNEYNTLTFLSKTIFQQIESHMVTHFPKHKPVEPLQLGITKAKIAQKKQNKYLEKRRRHRQNFNLREFDMKEVYDGQRIQNQIINKAKVSKHKKTQLKGWQQQGFDQQNFPLS